MQGPGLQKAAHALCVLCVCVVVAGLDTPKRGNDGQVHIKIGRHGVQVTLRPASMVAAEALRNHMPTSRPLLLVSAADCFSKACTRHISSTSEPNTVPEPLCGNPAKPRVQSRTAHLRLPGLRAEPRGGPRRAEGLLGPRGPGACGIPKSVNLDPPSRYRIFRRGTYRKLRKPGCERKLPHALVELKITEFRPSHASPSNTAAHQAERHTPAISTPHCIR